MPIRRDQIEAYERFAIRQAPAVPAPASCPSAQMVRPEERLTRPDPPASKPVREASVSGSAHLTAVLPIESLKMFQDCNSAIEQLAGTCKNLIQERDFWKVKATSAVTKKASQEEVAREDKRIEALRRLLAKELHPDMAKTASEESALRTKLFKQLWPEIDRIAKGQCAK
ncbi:MAG: hypothetical protein ING02_16375 [Roseomonas sp.]|nr:hypothetical protein [Roseomonas sp.]